MTETLPPTSSWTVTDDPEIEYDPPAEPEPEPPKEPEPEETA